MISNNGYATYLPFIAMGSGCLAAGGILEAKYQDNMTEEEGKVLLTEAISAGIIHDEGSGSCVDLVIIKKDGVTYLRNHKTGE